MARAAAAGGSGSARALARSVAHRLKYYIDVQRKENSFDSLGSTRDEMESFTWYTHPAHLIEWEHGQPLEHNFNKVKLEASLRMYVGSAEECHRKVQESPGKQKALEKFIKEMAKDYAPDRMNEGSSKGTQRQNAWPCTPSSLHKTATPSMSAEEVRRLVSSASKFIVAATSDIPPKVLGTTREVVSTPKRRATQSIPRVGRVWKQSSSTQPHKDEAESRQECDEEFQPERKEKALEENGGKIPKTTKRKKKVKFRPNEMSSGTSCYSYTSNDFCVGNVSFTSPYAPPGQNEVPRKGILKNRMSTSRTSSETSQRQKTQPNAHWKGYPPILTGHSRKPVKTRRKKSTCTPIGVDSRSFRSREPLPTQPVLTSGDAPQVTRNNTQACSVNQTPEMMQAPSPKISEETGELYSSTVDSGCAVLQGEAKETRDQANRPEESEGGLDSAAKRNSDCHRAHFQQWYQPRDVGRKHNSSLDNFGEPEDATLPIASVDESNESRASLQDERDKGQILAVTCGPSLGSRVGQGTDKDAPARSTANESGNIGGRVANQDVDGHSGNLLYQLLSLSEAEAEAASDPTDGTLNDLILGGPWGQQMEPIPATLPGVGKTSADGDCSSALPDRSTPVLGRLENDVSDEEFTVSSVCSSLSAKSLTGIESRKTNAELKEREENTRSCAELPVPNAMPESSTAQQRTRGQHSERLSSPAGEKRANKDRGPEETSSAHVVYFSHLPTSL